MQQFPAEGRKSYILISEKVIKGINLTFDFHMGHILTKTATGSDEPAPGRSLTYLVIHVHFKTSEHPEKVQIFVSRFRK